MRGIGFRSVCLFKSIKSKTCMYVCRFGGKLLFIIKRLVEKSQIPLQFTQNLLAYHFVY